MIARLLEVEGHVASLRHNKSPVIQPGGGIIQLENN